VSDGVLPPNGAEYPQMLRGENYQWWRSVLGATFALSLYLLLVTVVSRAVVMLAWATTAAQINYQTYYAEASGLQRPVGLLATNLGIITLLPITWAIVWVIHQVRPRWLSSVQPRIRWRYLAACLVVAVVALDGMLLLSTLVAGAPPIALQPHFWGFLVVIILTSPIQAVAEEIFFRGYLLQTLGSLVARPWFGVVVSSVVFALLHGTLNPGLFADRLAFGLVAAVLVWRTGGLEAGIAAHVINNISAFVFAGLTTSIGALMGIKTLGWADAAFDIGGFALFALLAYGLSRRFKLQTRVNLTTG